MIPRVRALEDSNGPANFLVAWAICGFEVEVLGFG